VALAPAARYALPQMGLEISVVDELAPYPRPIRLVLICEGCLFSTRQEFRHDDGFIGCYREAMAAGWKDAHEGGRRVILGPCCSGKGAK
jgi:hypothetical protein